jgi:hypothetical protein
LITEDLGSGTKSSRTYRVSLASKPIPMGRIVVKDD